MARAIRPQPSEGRPPAIKDAVSRKTDRQAPFVAGRLVWDGLLSTEDEAPDSAGDAPAVGGMHQRVVIFADGAQRLIHRQGGI